MYHNEFRRTLSLSSATLPVALLLSWLCRVLPQITAWESWVGWACAVAATHLMIESNHQLQFLQRSTRMFGALLLLLLTGVYPFSTIGWHWLVLLSVIVSLVLLLHSYRNNDCPGLLFYSFACLGVAAFFFPPYLLVALYAWLVMLVLLRSMSLRNFMGSLIGLLFPYWFYLGWQVWNNKLEVAFQYVLPYLRVPKFSLTIWTLPQQVAVVFLLVLTFFSITHYFRTSLKDKINVRRYYICAILLQILLVALLFTFPTYYDYLIGLLAVNTAPMATRYFNLAKGGRWFDAWTKFWVLLLALLIFINSPLIAPYLP